MLANQFYNSQGRQKARATCATAQGGNFFWNFKGGIAYK